MAKLKEEREAYLEYQKVQRELDRLTKFSVAWQFVCAEETSEKTWKKSVCIMLDSTAAVQLLCTNRFQLCNLLVDVKNLVVVYFHESPINYNPM